MKCPLGHEQKSRGGFAIVPGDLHVNVCQECGIVFDGRITNKEEFEKSQSQEGERNEV